jgi:hypothetical protein
MAREPLFVPCVRLVGADERGRIYECASTSRADVTHEVTIAEDGSTACTCEDATFRGKTGSAYIEADAQAVCRHQRLLLKQLHDRAPHLLEIETRQ